MAQLFSAFFFCLAGVAAIGLIAAMLREEWGRVTAILSGCDLAGARMQTPRPRVRMRSGTPAELRRTPRPLRAAA